MSDFTKFNLAVFIFFSHLSNAQNIPGVYVSAGIGQTICATWQAALSGNAGDSVTTPVWTTSGDGTFSDPDALDAIYTPGSSDISSRSAILTLTGNSIGSGIAVSDNMVVTIIPSVPPQPQPITGAPIVVCPPLNEILLRTNHDAGATNYVWSSVHPGINFSPASTADTQSVNFLPATSAEYIINVSAYNLCGASPAQTVHIRRTVNVSILNGAAVACAGTSKQYTCNHVTGAVSYKWKTTGGITINGHSSPFITNDTAINAHFPVNFNAGTISVAAMTSCFTGPFKTFSISKSLPALTLVSGNPSVCSVIPETYSVIPVPGVATYTWTLPSNSSGNSATNIINVNFDSSFTGSSSLCVTATSMCGVVTPPSCKTIFKGPPEIPGTISGPATNVCGQTVTYSVTGIQGVIYDWTVPNGVSVNGNQHGNNITATIPSTMNTGNIRVSATNSCGTSALQTLAIKGAPAKPSLITTNIYPVYPLTSGVEFRSNINTPAYSLTWNYPTSASYVSGQGTPNLVLNWGNENGNVTLTAANSCGSSSRQYFVNVNAKRETGNPSTVNNSKVQQPLEKTGQSFNLQVYPDAENKAITFTFNASVPGSYYYSIHDDSNREVRTGILEAEEGVNMEYVDMSSLPPDMVYNFTLSDGKNSTRMDVRLQ